MKCLRRVACTAPHAYDAHRALINVLSPALQRRFQSNTVYALDDEDADGTSTLSNPHIIKIYKKFGRHPTSRHFRKTSSSSSKVRGQEGDNDTNRATRDVGVHVSEELDDDMRGLLHPEVLLHITDWSANPDGTRKWQQRMQVIAQTMACLQSRKDGKPIDDVPQVLREYIDYEETRLTPKRSFVQPPLPVPWQLPISAYSSSSGVGSLNQEIKAFISHLNCTPSEKAARESAIEETMALIRSATTQTQGFPYNMELFGSEKTGLAVATSDIDIRLYGKVDARVAMSFLARLCHDMNKSHRFSQVTQRKSASYPIINATHLPTGLEIQLVASDSSAVRETLIKKYLAEVPHLRELYLLVRTILSTRGLLDVFNGGLGSYATFMLVTAITRTRSFKKNVRECRDDNVASHFMSLLRFVAGMNTSKYGLLVEEGEVFQKHDHVPEQLERHISDVLSHPHRTDAAKTRIVDQLKLTQRSTLQPYKLCMQDPADSTNDLGRKCHAYKYIRFAMHNIWSQLRSTLQEIEIANASGKPLPRSPLLGCVVGRAHELESDRRRLLEYVGQRALQRRNSRAQHASQRLNIAGLGRLYAI
nr:isoform f of non-canonical poly(a) rna polymerase protein trf4-1 [Quercus suber]